LVEWNLDMDKNDVLMFHGFSYIWVADRFIPTKHPTKAVKDFTFH
jgi:hypothetical protein